MFTVARSMPGRAAPPRLEPGLPQADGPAPGGAGPLSDSAISARAGYQPFFTASAPPLRFFTSRSGEAFCWLAQNRSVTHSLLENSSVWSL